MITMAKRKTSINIEEEVWKRWILFVVNKYGSSRKVSEATAEALQFYIKQNEKKDIYC